MANDFDSTDDLIDTRDICERIEELETELEAACEGQSENNIFENWLPNMAADDAGTFQEAAQELIALRKLVEEINEYAGDDCKDGVHLIRDSYFETAMDEMLEDIGDLPKNLPSYLKITVDYDELKMDYTSVEYEGVTFWFR